MKFKKMFFDTDENFASRKCLSEGKIYIHGYRKADGTYVRGYCREMTNEERENARREEEELHIRVQNELQKLKEEREKRERSEEGKK